MRAEIGGCLEDLSVTEKATLSAPWVGHGEAGAFVEFKAAGEITSFAGEWDSSGCLLSLTKLQISAFCIAVVIRTDEGGCPDWIT